MVLRHPLVRLAIAAALGATAAVVLLGALSWLNSGDGFTGATAATSFGWLVPIGAIALGGVLAFSLYSLRSPKQTEPDALGMCRCSRCGGTVLGEWRLCPHCGVSLSDPDSSVECRLV